MVSFSNPATGLWEKAESKAESVGMPSSRSPSRQHLGTDSWCAVEELFPSSRVGTCKTSPANLQEGPSPFIPLSFLKLLHTRARLTFWLSAKEFDP